jgi:hypothetical protein
VPGEHAALGIEAHAPFELRQELAVDEREEVVDTRRDVVPRTPALPADQRIVVRIANPDHDRRLDRAGGLQLGDLAGDEIELATRRVELEDGRERIFGSCVVAGRYSQEDAEVVADDRRPDVELVRRSGDGRRLLDAPDERQRHARQRHARQRHAREHADEQHGARRAPRRSDHAPSWSRTRETFAPPVRTQAGLGPRAQRRGWGDPADLLRRGEGLATAPPERLTARSRCA